MKENKHVKYPIKSEIFDEEDFIKDCPNYQFVPTILPSVSRIIAMGDIHGDYQLAVKSFKLARLIDDNFNWIAEPSDTVVVQVGDQIDSCRPIVGTSNCHYVRQPGDSADDIKVIEFFNQMHQKAQNANPPGSVYSLLGNHELMNAEAKFDYVSYDNYQNFNYQNAKVTYQGPSGRKNAFKPGGPISSMMACTRPSVLVIGSTMFVHAGMLPVLAQRLEFLGFDSKTKLKYLNAVVRKWLLRKLVNNIDLDHKTMFVNDLKISPFWTRIYGSIPLNVSLESGECFDSVKKAIEVYKVGRLVVGHTPQLYTNRAGINGTCYEQDGEKKLYRVDGGFSKAFNFLGKSNFIQVLEIINDQEFRILSDHL